MNPEEQAPQEAGFVRQESFVEKVKNILSASKYFTGLTVILLVIGLTGTVYLSQHNSDNRQHAAASTAGPIYWGAFIVESGSTWNENVDIFESHAGKKISIFDFGNPWVDPVSHAYVPFPTSQFDAVRARGIIPFYTWASWGIPNQINQPDFSLSAIINGNYDTFLRQWATDAKAWGHPFFLRFDWEMNGDWYPWSEKVNGNHSGQFVAMWRHVHDIFTQVGATNVTWVWTISREYSGGISSQEVYPGDNYVDWTAIDAYNMAAFNGQPWESFSQVFTQSYNDVLAIAPLKPLMIGETSSNEQQDHSKAQWIKDLLETQLPQNFPRVQAFMWFNWNAEPHSQWVIESSAASQQAFASGIASSYYATNTFGNINTSPIQPITGNLVTSYHECAKTIPGGCGSTYPYFTDVTVVKIPTGSGGYSYTCANPQTASPSECSYPAAESCSNHGGLKQQYPQCSRTIGGCDRNFASGVLLQVQHCNDGTYLCPANLAQVVAGQCGIPGNTPTPIPTVTPTPADAPKGYLDGANCTSPNVFGWTCDSESYNQPLGVDLYANAPAGQGGIYLDTVLANINRPDVVSVCGGTTAHGFSYVIPSILRDGHNHTIYAYGINPKTGRNTINQNNTMLIGSPKTFSCANTPKPTPQY